MSLRFLQPFTVITSTLPSFDVVIAATSVATALESTAVREWAGPGGRAIRVATITADDYRMQFGSSLAVASTAGSAVILGGTVEVFKVARPSDTFVAFHSSTDVIINVTLGYGQ